MNIEQSVNSHLNKYPRLKKIVKRCYQRSICAFSPSRAKAVGDITPVSPNDGYEYFFGYYDKSPWDATDCYMLCMKARDTWSDVSPREKAQIILIDTAQRNKVTHLAETSSWNVQQGCMLQWLGPDYRSRVIFNDCRDGRYCSVILKLDIYGSNISVREENVLPAPVYSVASDGSFALTLDFSRLYRLRPGYGYYNIPENTASEKIPDAPCIWYMSLKNGEIKPVLKYTDFAHFEPRKEMEGAEHKVNHIMISPNGKRFMVLHRWFQNSRKYTRLITCNVDGTEMFNLSDDDMTSHCCWKNDEEILAFANKRAGGCGYYLMKDKTHVYEHFWSGIDYDGHPSYSPDGSKIVFDRYPDRSRMASVMVSSAENREIDGVHTLARVFAPFKYDNDTRCDLHPRWNRKGDKICFDSVYDGHRRLCFVNLYDREEKADCDNQSLIMESRTKILYIVDSLKQRFGVTSVVMNYFRNIDKKYLQIDFLVFNDSEREIIDEIRNAGSDVFFMPKPCVKNIPYIIKFYKTFFEIHNDYKIVHSHINQIDSVIFPIAKKYGVKHCISHSHNTKYSDYMLRAIRNWIMCLPLKKAADTWAACGVKAGEFLFGKNFMKSPKHLVINNAIDIDRFRYNAETRASKRKELGFTSEFVIGNVGSLKLQKNQKYLLLVFARLLDVVERPEDYRLVIVGDGDLKDELLKITTNLKISKYVIFTGARKDVNKFLQAMDVFVLPSLYEGLPVIGIEAQASGLPCLFSDNITREVDICNTQFIALSENKDIWVNAIINTQNFERKDCTDIIRENGFSIKYEAIKLSKFYECI